MAIRYLNKNHCPEDPGGMIQEALDMGPEFPGPAEDLFMSWTLRLTPEVPTSSAAGQLLERDEAKALLNNQNLEKSSPIARLLSLLKDTASGVSLTAPRRRRGGWRAKRQ